VKGGPFPVKGGPVKGGPVAETPVKGGPVKGGPLVGGPVKGGPLVGGGVGDEDSAARGEVGAQNTVGAMAERAEASRVEERRLVGADKVIYVY